MLGKAGVLQEETAECTAGAAGVGVLASRERFSEITTGRSHFQLGWQQLAKTLLSRGNLKEEEDLGLAHEAVVAMSEG